MSDPDKPGTIAARAGLGRPEAGEGADLVEGPAVAAVRAFAELADLDRAMGERTAYRRDWNRSVALLEAAMASLESPAAEDTLVARGTASGQAALLLALTLLAGPKRRRVVVVRPCYGGSDALVAGPLGNFGLRLTAVDLPPPADGGHGELVAAALDDDVAAVVTEVITNPLMGVVDVPAVIEAAHQAGAAAIVDSTFTTPFLFRPFELGADLVFHSLTKHLSGHSDVLGGVLLARADHPAADWLDPFSRLVGAALSPFDAWLALRGLRTAALRIERGSENAAALADWLQEHEAVSAVHYPGVRGGSDHERACRLLPHGRGPMLSFDLGGGAAAAGRFVGGLKGIRLAPSLGDVATTVSHPAFSSHRTLSREQRAVLGISDSLIRVSTGVEAFEDLRREFSEALGATM